MKAYLRKVGLLLRTLPLAICLIPSTLLILTIEGLWWLHMTADDLLQEMDE